MHRTLVASREFVVPKINKFREKMIAPPFEVFPRLHDLQNLPHIGRHLQLLVVGGWVIATITGHHEYVVGESFTDTTTGVFQSEMTKN